MNRLKISFSVLVLLAVLCVTGLVTVHRQCTSFDAQVHRVMETAASGDTAAALKEFDALYAQWEKFHDWTGLFVDGEQLDHIREIKLGHCRVADHGRYRNDNRRNQHDIEDNNL